MHTYYTAQMALVLGGLLGQDVTFEGLCTFHGATGTNAKSLLRAAFGLHFGHLHAPFSFVLVRRRQQPVGGLVGPEPLFSEATCGASVRPRTCTLGLEPAGDYPARPILCRPTPSSAQEAVELLLSAAADFEAVGFLRPGAIIMIIWRPSNLGNCSTTIESASSSRMRFSNARPSSWCVISRPRKRSVILHLSPSSRKRLMLRILML